MANETINFTSGNLSLNITPVNLPFMDKVFYGNTVREYIIALIFFVASALIMKLISYLIIKIMEHIERRHPTQFKEITVKVLKAFRLPLFIIISLEISSKFIQMPVVAERVLKYLMIIFLTFYAIKAINAVISHSSKKIIEKREKEYNDNDRTLGIFLANVLSGVVWILGVVFLLDQFGVNVSKILAGLGIAGIAVAFALQNILGDIFASVSIYFDKPFKPGDYIMFDGYEGNVIRTGIKSTRIKLLRGEELIVSNKLLTESKLQNVDKLEKRRVAQNIQVKYGTSKSKLEKLPGMIEKIVKKYKKNAEFDRCHLKSFKEYSIEFELVYNMKNSDYRLFMDTQEKINLDILELFEKEGMEFAVPTRIIHVQK